MIRATVLTDASFSGVAKGKPGFAGWAAWVAIDNMPTIRDYGPLKVAVCDSVEAEMYAALNGVWLAARAGAQEILLRTDCEPVLGILDGRTKAHRLVMAWHAAVAAHAPGVIIKGRHVKGHGPINSRASFVNDWCDRHAVAARKEAQRRGRACQKP